MSDYYDSTGKKKCVSLGKFNSPQSRQEHARICAEVAAGVAEPGTTTTTVAELCLSYLKFAGNYYLKDGKPTNELPPLRTAIKALRETHGHVPVHEFTPRSLVAVRDRMVALGWCRRSVNKQVARIRRVFKWGVAEMLVKADTLTALSAVAPLKEGRSKAREKAKVTAVDDASVVATLPHLSGVVRAMVQLQRCTGMRPGEVMVMRPADIDRTGDVWVYTPARHKCEHLGRERHILLGKKAQGIINPLLDRDLGAYLFDPREAVAELRERQRAERTGRDGGSGGDRKKKRGTPKRKAGTRYTANAYRVAVHRGVGRANVRRARLANGAEFDAVPDWHPNQLRHAAAAEIAATLDIERARAALGHSTTTMTANYAKSADGKLAAEVALLIG